MHKVIAEMNNTIQLLLDMRELTPRANCRPIDDKIYEICDTVREVAKKADIELKENPEIRRLDL